jgi:hypothetical protein
MFRNALCLTFALALVACKGEMPSPGTAAPPATASQPAADSGKVLFSDDFSSPASGWSRTIPGNPVQTEYRDGQYVVSMDNSASAYGVASGFAPTEFDDVRIEIEAKRVAAEERGPVGVSCRGSNAGRYFADIDGATVRIGIYAKEQEILSETNNPGLWKSGEVNQLRLDCVGNQLTFHINGSQVLAATDARLPIGKVGLQAGGAGEGKVEVLFDNLVVKKP